MSKRELSHTICSYCGASCFIRFDEIIECDEYVCDDCGCYLAEWEIEISERDVFDLIKERKEREMESACELTPNDEYQPKCEFCRDRGCDGCWEGKE